MHFFFLQPCAITLLTCLCCISSLRLIARAADDDTTIHEDHNHHRLLNILEQRATYGGAAIKEKGYEPDFAGLPRAIIGRAPEGDPVLGNNAPKPMNIDQDDIQYWTFPKKALQPPSSAFDLKRQLNLTATNITGLEGDLIHMVTRPRITGSPPTVWVTISTCDQPTSKSADSGTPPPLEVYISRSSNNQQPHDGRSDHFIDVTEGFGNITLSGVTDDIWIGVKAPKSESFSGVYNYELVASTDAPYATYFGSHPDPTEAQIQPWDTDSNSSILATGDITNALSNSSIFNDWLGNPPPFSIYVNSQADPSRLGLQRSVCGLRNHAQVQASNNSMVTIGGQPKQLFYVSKLNRSTSYDAIMTFEQPFNTSAIGRGGAVWAATSFTTKSDQNCQIIHSLSFCSSVAYAVPFSPDSKLNSTLANTYDGYARDAYQNFNKSLQQIPCETTPSAQYSLARNCQDCDDAYRAWLCAVMIPRCADFSSPPTLTHLIPRNMNRNFINGTAVPNGTEGSVFSHDNKTSNAYTSSRHPKIDEQIAPGPYKEMLPCKDL
ncbi:MAG: hypothetical protein L6R39_002018, partial [Caloplaca ligustica]